MSNATETSVEQDACRVIEVLRALFANPESRKTIDGLKEIWTGKLTRAQQAERRKELANMVRDGFRPSQVARDNGVTISHVKISCKEHDVNYEREHSKRKLLEIVASLLHREGKSHSAIARDHGVSRQYVSQVFTSATKAGIFRDAR